MEEIVSGNGGCTTWSCYFTLFITSIVALLSLYDGSFSRPRSFSSSHDPTIPDVVIW